MLGLRRNTLYLVLAGIFITNALTAELIGGKLIDVFGIPMSIGILPWPIVFLTTDLINEYFGRGGVRKITLLTALLIIYCFVVLFFALRIPATPDIPGVTDGQFTAVFGQSQLIIIGSITAFVITQFLDMAIFHFVKERTGSKWLWLRSTGSTVISQFLDSFIVLGIAFWLPGKMPADVYFQSGMAGYLVKVSIAILLTPLIYIGHGIIDKYLEKDES